MKPSIYTQYCRIERKLKRIEFISRKAEAKKQSGAKVINLYSKSSSKIAA